MKKQIKFKLAELFCGPGGLALGAMRSAVQNDSTSFQIEPVWANDIDQDTCNTYSRNIHGGLTKTKALFYNFLSALTAVLGGLLGYFFLSFFEKINYITVAMTAGVFIYIACTDLIPEVHKENKKDNKWGQTISFILGIIIIYLLQSLISI